MTTPRLTIVTSDQPSVLMDRLAADIRRAPLSPLDREVVVVQSQGMARWVRLELARRHGCAASLDMPFPAAFSHRLAAALERASGVAPNDAASDQSFGRDALTWRILSMLEDGLADEPPFEPLRSFVADKDVRKRLGLAERIAGRFDDYQLYRPDVLLAWESDGAPDEATPHERWQGALWRRLCGGRQPRHLARRFDALLHELEHREPPIPGLPSRISVFGVSTLPPVFVTLMQRAARFVPVTVYASAPPRSTWLAGAPQSPANPLFASLGTQAREFLEELDADGVEWDERHNTTDDESLGGHRCLQTLQADIRAGRARGHDAAQAAPVSLRADDASLTVHVCHSPMREMEVLRDQLYDALARDPALRPHDILVLVPNITAYAPFIDTVFGVDERSVPSLPYHVADRTIAQEHCLGDALLRLLQLAGSRCSAADVLALLDVAAVRRAAGLSADAAQLAHRWVSDSAIRWGEDATSRGTLFDLPPFEANSWRAGIDRLLMGYATGPLDSLVAGVLPSSGDTMGSPAELGEFAAWLTRLFAALAEWHTPRSLGEWSARLLDDIDRFFVTDDDGEERALGIVRGCVEALARLGEHSGSKRPVELRIVRDWLARSLGDDSFGSGFLAGGVTFCALKPMRSIPFKVIAVAGLDDDKFPRRARHAAFDLMESKPRPGDRNLRADDRQLFLDVLLAARDRLILSYVGRSIQNNKVRAPSVVVAELLDQIDRAFVGEADARGKRRAARERIVVDHMLQPFSAAYFENAGDDRMFTYSRAHAAMHGANRGQSVKPFVDAALPRTELSGADGDTSGKQADITLRALIDCWTNPSEFFAKRILDITLVRSDEMLLDAEPMEVDGLLRWKVNSRALDRHLAGTRTRETELLEVTARGELPPGELTRAWHRRLDGELDPLIERIGAADFVEPRAAVVHGDGWTITGRLDSLTRSGRLQARAAKIKSKDKITGWITHLFLNACPEMPDDCVPRSTRLIGYDAEVVFTPVPNAKAQLALLVEGYRLASKVPLPVFEHASHAYAKQVRSTRATKSPMQCAIEAFARTSEFEFGPRDSDDAYVELCWRGIEPLSDCREDFIKWSDVLWASALANAAGAAG